MGKLQVQHGRQRRQQRRHIFGRVAGQVSVHQVHRRQSAAADQGSGSEQVLRRHGTASASPTATVQRRLKTGFQARSHN